MEDDWNDGQKLVLKAKHKGEGSEFSTSMKIGEEKDGKHKVAAEEKMKLKGSECGGWETEMKMKNNGSISYECESNYLQVSNLIASNFVSLGYQRHGRSPDHRFRRHQEWSH